MPRQIPSHHRHRVNVNISTRDSYLHFSSSEKLSLNRPVRIPLGPSSSVLSCSDRTDIIISVPVTVLVRLLFPVCTLQPPICSSSSAQKVNVACMDGWMMGKGNRACMHIWPSSNCRSQVGLAFFTRAPSSPHNLAIISANGAGAAAAGE